MAAAWALCQLCHQGSAAVLREEVRRQNDLAAVAVFVGMVNWVHPRVVLTSSMSPACCTCPVCLVVICRRCSYCLLQNVFCRTQHGQEPAATKRQPMAHSNIATDAVMHVPVEAQLYLTVCVRPAALKITWHPVLGEKPVPPSIWPSSQFPYTLLLLAPLVSAPFQPPVHACMHADSATNLCVPVSCICQQVATQQQQLV